jgi:proton-translocating NADH-quinone oxidoreductase chain N
MKCLGVPMSKKEFFPMAFSHDSSNEYMIEYTQYLFDIDLQALLPEVFLSVTGCCLLLYGVVLSTQVTHQYPLLMINMSWLTLLGFFYTLLLVVNMPLHTVHVLYNTLVIDDFTQWVKGLVLLSSFLCIYISMEYMKAEALNAFETVLLMLFATLSMCFLVSSADFISLYLALELQGLAFYVMAAVKRNSEFSTEAGLKYFMLGAFSSGVLLFGCGLLYGFTGVTNFTEMGKIFTGGTESILASTTSLPACELGMVCILVGFFFKIAAAPFHMWSPDVYEGAPTSVTAFFLITPKVALFAVFLRIFLESFYDFFIPWQKIVILCSITSMIFGCFGALSQMKMKRLLAWSSIGHGGYLLAGFACGSIEGIQALLLYLLVYVCMNINIFALLLCSVTREDVHTVPRIKYITDVAYIAKTHPVVAGTFTLTLFSMAGIPPLAGFYSKAYLFFAAVSSNLYLVAIIGVLTSVVSCFYYIRLVKIMYFETPRTWCRFDRVPHANALTLAASAFFILFFMAYPAPFHLMTHKAALALCV